eukprot:CAMPEP_0181173910 /NCGR_PEP_ID=MMETSP1096-20121128/3253_1 /TAXON_ID=156174 ORGANISM="Chrysochromulina ericina, Strain CCMP281" /NCGR_SAMPLE_ID=MMETSP1096 /ASSEMBLY_ACC=CAM_ASM_000453 /LENGTH=299 /DNA_ID=CAMNT_0023261773 /DNA_START=246 /DNA_END=1145 /DNA_ORIENTATION=-
MVQSVVIWQSSHPNTRDDSGQLVLGSRAWRDRLYLPQPVLALPRRARAAGHALCERILSMNDDEALAEGTATLEVWMMRDDRNRGDHLRKKLLQSAFEKLESAAYHEDAQRLCLHGKAPLGRLTELDISGAEHAQASFYALIAEHLAPQLEAFICEISSVCSPVVNTGEDGGKARRALLSLLQRAGRLSVLRVFNALEADELLAVADATSHNQSLRKVDCSWSSNVTNESVARVATAAPHLQEFKYVMVDYNRSGVSELTAVGAKALREMCPAAVVDIRLMVPNAGRPRSPIEEYILRL